jgi:hypothetical protein
MRVLVRDVLGLFGLEEQGIHTCTVATPKLADSALFAFMAINRGDVKPVKTRANCGEQTHKELRVAMYSIDMSYAGRLQIVSGIIVRYLSLHSRLGDEVVSLTSHFT